MTLIKNINMTFFRPEWTCGRYNAMHDVAIFYNLLAGTVHLFEDASAHLIGLILKYNRNEMLSLENIALQMKCEPTDLIDFFCQLCDLGLLTQIAPTLEVSTSYREFLSQAKRKSAEAEMSRFRKSGVLINHESVEMKYMERCNCIFSLMLELTYNCSEKCIHCYNPGATRNDIEKSGRNTVEPLSLVDYKRLIDELNQQGLVKVCLTGGDPFSNPLVWDIIDYLWQNEIAIDIFTNGQKIVHCMDRLATYYPRTLGISLYSNVASVHDAITRIPGSHKRTIKVLEECNRLSIPTLIKCCIMKPNVTSYTSVKDVAHDLGMLVQFELNITDSLDGDKCASKYLRLGHEELQVVLRDIDLPYYIDGTKSNNISALPSLNGKMCNAGIASLCITPDGDVEPCCAFPMKCGNIKKLSVKDIIKADKMKKWRCHTVSQCHECWTHEYCIFCQLCPGNNYNTNKDYLKPSENNCFLAKERYDLYISMSKGFDPLDGKSIEEALNKLEIKVAPLKRIFE